MNPKLNRKSNGAFTLVEIIGVLAIIGILAAVVTPRVIDGIREGRITQLSQNLGQWKSGADRYLQKHQRLPVDASVEARDPVSGNLVNYPGTATQVASANTTFGDVLIAQGLISAITVPFGDNTLAPTASEPGAVTDIADVPPVNDQAQIRCVEFTGSNERSFTATRTRDVPYRVAFLLIPNVPLQEAAAIKTKIDGPFPGVAGDPQLLDAAIAQAVGTSGITGNTEALFRGNCRVAAGDGAGTAETYNLYLYITND